MYYTKNHLSSLSKNDILGKFVNIEPPLGYRQGLGDILAGSMSLGVVAVRPSRAISAPGPQTAACAGLSTCPRGRSGSSLRYNRGRGMVVHDGHAVSHRAS